jgi:hypothetical protein
VIGFKGEPVEVGDWVEMVDDKYLAERGLSAHGRSVRHVGIIVVMDEKKGLIGIVWAPQKPENDRSKFCIYNVDYFRAGWFRRLNTLERFVMEL